MNNRHPVPAQIGRCRHIMCCANATLLCVVKRNNTETSIILKTGGSTELATREAISMQQGRVVVVTGAGGGISSRIADRFLANGDTVLDSTAPDPRSKLWKKVAGRAHS